ncbi:MAG: hypothetical protein AAFU73_13520 [Planctomycetota bacterium]
MGTLPPGGPERQTSPDGSFRLARGCFATDLVGVAEGFAAYPPDEHGARILRVNASAERIAEVYLALADVVTQPAFLVLETPTHRAVEEELRQTDEDPFHVDTHYLDGLSAIDHRLLFEGRAELLTQCGMVLFGYGSHEAPEQVLVDGYKCITVRTVDALERFTDALRGVGIEEDPGLRTVWQSFSQETPGRTERVTVDGRTVYDLVEELGERGLYFARRREGSV